MADKKISQFTLENTPNPNDVIPFVRSGNNYIITVQNLLASVNFDILQEANNRFLGDLYLDNRKVNKFGDEMTGFLTLHSHPSSNMHAATKGYVDQLINNLPGNIIVPFTYNNDDIISENYGLILVDANANDVDLKLPANPTTGKIFYFKRIDNSGNTVSISGDGKTIDGANSFNLNVQYSSKSIIYNGTEWSIVSNY